MNDAVSFPKRQTDASVLDTASAADSAADAPDLIDLAAENRLVRKVFLRLVPFLFFLYIIAYLDRVNVGFAKLQMQTFPWMTEKVFGFGAGVFFIGYFLFEIPSNLLLEKVGARRWIARIMVTWGLIAMGMLFTQSRNSFYGLRFALGLAEAGFFPGVLLYLTYWFTARERARVIALFMTANSVAFIFGGPLSGWLVGLPEVGGLAGWQQLFLWEGLPAVLMGGVVLWYLPNGPDEAAWLTDTEKALIQTRLRRERGPAAPIAHPSPLKALTSPGVLLLCVTFFCSVVGMYGISMWMPQIIDEIGKQTPNGKLTPLQVGLITAIPYTSAGVCMVLNGFHSDRTGERKKHIIGAALVGAVGLMGCAFFPTPWPSLFFVTVAAGGMWATNGPFWALVPQLLRRGGPGSMAGGIALINAVGNLGGFVGPYLIGAIKEQTQSFAAGLFTLAGSLVLGTIILTLNREASEIGSLTGPPAPQ